MHVSTACSTPTVSNQHLFLMGQRFWACHNHWFGHSHFGTKATKVLLRTLAFLGKLWRSFRPADQYKNLVITRRVYNTVWTSSSARISFPGTLKPHKFQKVASGCASSNPTSRGITPLKSPVVYILVPRHSEKPVFFVFFNLAQFHHNYFYTFCTKLWCLKQVLLIMTPKGVIRG